MESQSCNCLLQQTEGVDVAAGTQDTSAPAKEVGGEVPLNNAFQGVQNDDGFVNQIGVLPYGVSSDEAKAHQRVILNMPDRLIIPTLTQMQGLQINLEETEGLPGIFPDPTAAKNQDNTLPQAFEEPAQSLNVFFTVSAQDGQQENPSLEQPVPYRIFNKTVLENKSNLRRVSGEGNELSNTDTRLGMNTSTQMNSSDSPKVSGDSLEQEGYSSEAETGSNSSVEAETDKLVVQVEASGDESTETSAQSDVVPTLSFDPFVGLSPTRTARRVVPSSDSTQKLREQTNRQQRAAPVLDSEEQANTSIGAKMSESGEETTGKTVPTIQFPPPTSGSNNGWVATEVNHQSPHIRCEAAEPERDADASVPTLKFPPEGQSRTTPTDAGEDRGIEESTGLGFTQVLTEFVRPLPTATIGGVNAQIYFPDSDGDGIMHLRNVIILTGKDANEFIKMFKCGTLPEGISVEVWDIFE